MLIPTTILTSGSVGSIQLDYVELTSDVVVTATTEAGAQTILSSAALSYDGSTRICIEIYAALVNAGAFGGGNDLICNLWDGGTDLNRLAQVRAIAPGGANVGNGVPIFARRFLTPSNGTHTFHWKAWRTAADGSISANTTDYIPAYMRIATA